jgi:hypothetical protein
MKCFGLSIFLILSIVTSALAQMPAPTPEPATAQTMPERPNSITICAGNVPPEDMVITATGTSSNCAGSCRARTVEPVQGPVMVICADQPIPKYYETESTTTTPACNCIGDEDNAYVIRRMNGAPTPTPIEPMPLPMAPSNGRTNNNQ